MSIDHSPIPCPVVVPLDAILPEEPLLMMGAGPVPIPAAVAKANTIVINHLGATMAKIIEQVKEMARYVFQTRTKWVLGVAGPGSAAMEMAISNLAWRGTRVLSIRNGFFSARMAEMATRVGAEVATLEVADRAVASLDEVAEAIARERPEIVTIVQGETSNTVWNRDLRDIAALAKAAGALVVVDAVCTLSTMPLEMDAWGIDAVITGGQKGLSSIPGVSLIAFSDAAWERMKHRPEPNAHWCLDMALAEQCDAEQGSAYGADPGPHRIRGADLQRFQRRGVAARVRGDARKPLRAPSALFARAAGGRRGDGAEAVCAEGMPAQFGRRDRDAGRPHPGPDLRPYLEAVSGRDLGLVRVADRPDRADGRTMPRAPPVPHRARAGQHDARPGRDRGSAVRHGGTRELAAAFQGRLITARPSP